MGPLPIVGVHSSPTMKAYSPLFPAGTGVQTLFGKLPALAAVLFPAVVAAPSKSKT